MTTDAFNHAPGQILMNTGSQIFGRPSVGAWVTYGLGCETAGPARLRRLQHRQERPERRQLELGERLPADRLSRRAVPCRRRPGPLPVEPRGVDGHLQRESLDAVSALNRIRLDEVGDPEIATRISSYEMAYRMQSVAPEVMDIGHEPQARSRDVRRRAGQALVRQQLPARPPAGRDGASASSRSSTRPGTSTATWSATSRRTARRPTRPARP